MELINDEAYLRPPSFEKEAVHECYFCDSSILEEENCYEIDNLIYCKNCMENHFKKVAEKPDIEGYLADLEHDEINFRR